MAKGRKYYFTVWDAPGRMTRVDVTDMNEDVSRSFAPGLPAGAGARQS